MRYVITTLSSLFFFFTAAAFAATPTKIKTPMGSFTVEVELGFHKCSFVPGKRVFYHPQRKKAEAQMRLWDEAEQLCSAFNKVDRLAQKLGDDVNLNYRERAALTELLGWRDQLSLVAHEFGLVSRLEKIAKKFSRLQGLRSDSGDLPVLFFGSILFFRKKFTINYSNRSFSNEDLGESYIKGGVARQAAYNLLRGCPDKVILPRDLDFWTAWPLNKLVQTFIDEGEDCRDHWGATPQQILEEKKVDVNLNLCILDAEGLWVHEDALEGFLKKEVWRVNDYKASKRAIRAHFFALRYGFEVKGSVLPQKHSYYRETWAKALALGVAKPWASLLERESVTWQPHVFSCTEGYRKELSREGKDLLEEMLLEEGHFFRYAEDWEAWDCWDEDGRVVGLLNKYTGESFISPTYLW